MSLLQGLHLLWHINLLRKRFIVYMAWPNCYKIAISDTILINYSSSSYCCEIVMCWVAEWRAVKACTHDQLRGSLCTTAHLAQYPPVRIPVVCVCTSFTFHWLSIYCICIQFGSSCENWYFRQNASLATYSSSYWSALKSQKQKNLVLYLM